MNKNEKINYITILDIKPIKINGKVYHRCKCECGKEKYILRHTLLTKRIRDCGCGTFMLKKYIGQKFGSFTIFECYRQRKNGRICIIAKAKCECGNTKNMLYSELKRKKNWFCCCKKTKELNNYIGKIYNGIEIIKFIDTKKKLVQCKCKCGNIFECYVSNLTNKKKYIIGCKKCVKSNNKSQKYLWNIKDDSNRLNSIYYNMKDRCFNTLNKDYKHYGKRGITVCEEWLNNILNFKKWAIEHGYQNNLTIDRIDNDGNYEPSNCRWVDIKTQANNRRNNRLFQYNGEKLTLSQICELKGLNVYTIRSRLHNGMKLEEAITIPIKKRRG